MYDNLCCFVCDTNYNTIIEMQKFLFCYWKTNKMPKTILFIKHMCDEK